MNIRNGFTTGIIFAVAICCSHAAIADAGPQGTSISNPTMPDQAGIPSDTDIRKILEDRVADISGKEDGMGIVVGIISPQGRRVIAYGHRDRGDSRPLDGDTAFEIGSVSKVFTALLLADMVQRGEIALDDPVDKYLPAGTRIPDRNGRKITFLDLATHTSGLPFMPDEVPVYGDPTTNYGDGQLYQFLGRYQLTRDPGTEWDYSNIGYWLLGQALAHRAGTSYEDLLNTRVLAPLKMKSTAIPPRLPTGLSAAVAVGHDASMQRSPAFSDVSIYSSMPAAGGIVSTVNDLLVFLASQMGYERSPLNSSMKTMLDSQRPIDNNQQGLGWVVTGKPGDQLIMHDGGTWGFASYVAWDPSSRIGVVVLSNQQTSVNDIGLHLLRAASHVERVAQAKHTEIKLDSTALDSYIGQYEAKYVGVFKITLDHGSLAIQLPSDWGLPKFQLHPEDRREFFVSEFPIHVIFQLTPDGAVTGLLVYPPRGQKGITAGRVRENR